MPELKRPPPTPASADEAKRIKELIADLALLNKPDFGLSPTMSGRSFAPIPGQAHASMFLLTDHDIQPSETVRALASLGPKALPFLLAALDDKMPTGIALKTPEFGGAMWQDDELDLNPVNPFEETAYKARVAARADRDDHEHDLIDSYSVKVGDVCFVIIGQIVSRRYRAVRYQLTAIIVVNSPTSNPKLCAEVRSLWKTDDPTGRLFDSLLADYATEGIFNGSSLDGWDWGNDFQCEAALRLLYYFPKESAQHIANRLGKLDVGRDADLNAFMMRCVKNGVRAKEFIKVVGWSKEPSVTAALVDVFRRAEDKEALFAALPAVNDPEVIRSTLAAAIKQLPVEEERTEGFGYKCLVALCQRVPDQAYEVLADYLRGGSVQRVRTACAVLREAKPAWDLVVLEPLLADKRTWGWTYRVIPGQSEPQLPIRVCDEVAITVRDNHPEFKFRHFGDYADLDRQIQVIRERIGRWKER